MNIFFLDRDAKTAAQSHCDKHVVKMILETAQLLSTAHHVLDEQVTDQLYRKTHVNHPSAKWVRSGLSQYQWSYQLFVHLLDEYTYRYEKTHATSRLWALLLIPPANLPRNAGWADPPTCMPDEFKVPDVVDSYRYYYSIGKRRACCPTNGVNRQAG